jgi:tetratricopeptide (TPR) repeat protein
MVLKRLLCLAPLVGTGCFLLAGDFPRTWQGRYDKAIQAIQEAKSEDDRFYALDEAAKSAFEIGKTDEARQHAQAVLDLAKPRERDWNYGNAIHDGHMVLGRVALKNGDVATARQELLLAGKTTGSPQLNSFGPNVSLARDLLERKGPEDVEAVVQYFALCGKFWEMERGNLERWTVLARGGVMPDFGANLLY